MRRRRAGRSALALAAVGPLLGLLAGCASIPPAPDWAPPPAAVPAVQVGDTAAQPDGTTPPDTPAPAVGPAWGTAGAVAGFDVRMIYSADPASPVAARWGEIPGDASFTALLRGRIADAIASHAAATGTPWTPSADAPAITPDQRGCLPGSSTRPVAELLADPGLTPQGAAPGSQVLSVSCEVLAAAGGLVVQALRTVTAVDGQATSDDTTVYYVQTDADAPGGAFVTTSDGFLTDDGLRVLHGWVVQALKISAGALRPEPTEDPTALDVAALRASFSHLAFQSDGSLVVTLPEGFSTPEVDALAGVAHPSPFVVTVPAAETAQLLGDQGLQVQAALGSGAAVALPAAPFRGREQVDCDFFACVAVTFDDGPGEYTDGVLDTLDARRAAATFFVQGYRVGGRAGTLQRMRDEGHEIGNHSWNHPDLTKLTDDEVRDQLGRTNAAIAAAVGSPATTFRPPYGAVDQRVLDLTPLPAILWTVDTNDWQLPDDATLLDRAVGQASPGAIVLLHDVHENTARMTPAIVDGLQGRGFTLVTVQQLLGGTLPSPHTTTSRG
ncbi:polysaccharide deacetylase family protein [Herbiconiux moechotypicola]|uniref:NodB homology domain-containing protein n=1 Tax=Herbiconiux moechotypicola TaxID=637393 RepID=A0ABN3D8L5_9MICO|nr:polysaccharide deacetylase family protein [Herbiconiux moechotypicola]MCS5728237.1 polysaccharide deacetylase family protein [Herbiconiux moechotypicola]